MRLLNFTIIKLTACLVIGIVIGYFFNMPLHLSLVLTGISLVFLLVLYLIAKKQFIKTVWFGVFSFITMILVGILVTNLHNEKNHSKHYIQLLSKEKDSLKTITFRIREVLKPSSYYDKYIVDLLEVDNTKVSGKSLLNIQKDSLTKPLKVDAIYNTKTQFKDVINPLNPHQFNYKTYLEKIYIWNCQ
jgi:competence protein ComEC